MATILLTHADGRARPLLRRRGAGPAARARRSAPQRDRPGAVHAAVDRAGQRLPDHRLGSHHRGAGGGVRAAARPRRLRPLRGRHPQCRRRRRLGERRAGDPRERRLRRRGGRARGRLHGRPGARHHGCHHRLSLGRRRRGAHGPPAARQHARHHRLRPDRPAPCPTRPGAGHARAGQRSSRRGGRAGADPDRSRHAAGRVRLRGGARRGHGRDREPDRRRGARAGCSRARI